MMREHLTTKITRSEHNDPIWRKRMSFNDPYMQAMLWTCKSCGFQLEGGQPPYECPLCESYKTNFIDIPQHIEKEVREEHADVPPNHASARARRVELIVERGLDKKRRAAGRILPAAAGNHINPSKDY